MRPTNCQHQKGSEVSISTKWRWRDSTGDIKHVLRGSSFIFGIMFLLVNPLAATPLFPHVSSLARAALFGLVVTCRGVGQSHQPQIWPKGPVRQCTIGTFPLSIRWWILEVVHSIFSCHRVSPDLSAMASPTLVMDPSDVACREVESNLRVAWRGSQRVNYVCVCYCMLCCMCVVTWWNCGWRWDQ
jgi:hypothetical protein